MARQIHQGKDVQQQDIQKILSKVMKFEQIKHMVSEDSDEPSGDEFDQFYQGKMRHLEDENLFQILRVQKEFVVIFKNWLERVLQRHCKFAFDKMKQS